MRTDGAKVDYLAHYLFLYRSKHWFFSRPRRKIRHFSVKKHTRKSRDSRSLFPGIEFPGKTDPGISRVKPYLILLSDDDNFLMYTPFFTSDTLYTINSQSQSGGLPPVISLGGALECVALEVSWAAAQGGNDGNLQHGQDLLHHGCRALRLEIDGEKWGVSL